MTEKRDKVNVEDIIGLIKTDEPTNSVEEVRKLRGRDDNNFYWYKKYKEVLNENEQLKQSIKEVVELLSEEVDVFSEKATEHNIIAYRELNQLDNKDAYYMATATKKAIKILKGVVWND